MGRRQKTNPDPPMKPPIDIIGAVAEMQATGDGLAPSAQEAASVCSATRSIPFVLAEEAAVAVGAPARLGGGHSPPVISHGETIGQVPEPNASAMRGCQRLGYVMQGTVTAVDPANGTGTLRVAGEMAMAA